MKYIRTELHGIAKVRKEDDKTISYENSFHEGCLWKQGLKYREAETIEELCDCFIKIKRKGNCKPYILKFDHKDLSTLKEQAIKYPTSPVYGAIHIEDKGLIYVAKMNEDGKLELL